tara:strand:+ start:97 stop:564 length:468 start_codon:yes stop_codon:yes gene_type:complete
MAKNINDWVDSYAESHQNSTNKKIHWVCVPLIMFSLLGLLSAVKLFDVKGFEMNLCYVLIIFAWLFYLNLSLVISIGMFFISALQLLLIYYLEINLDKTLLLYLYIVIFVVAWIGQFIGHKIEGQKPSFFEDLQFLLIGPAWIISFIYKKLGIKY